MKRRQEIEMLREFSDTNSASGFEEEFVRLFSAHTKNTADITVDGVFNVYAVERESKGDRPIIQTDLHSDAVGFITQAVRPNGLVEFVLLDGRVRHNILTLKVKIGSRDGEYIPDVVTTRPPYFMTTTERNSTPEVADMSIDAGLSSKEETIKDRKIGTGCPISVDVKCEYHEESGLSFGKDFDDRFGVDAMVDVLDNLKDEETDFDVVATLSSQEEVGLRGAYVAGRKIKPDLCIVLESYPVDDTFESDWLSQIGLKRGPMLKDMGTTFLPNPRFQRYVRDLADKNGIPHTRSVGAGGGQDGAIIYYEYDAPTIVIDIPARYEHPPYCFSAYRDFEASVGLATVIIRDVTQGKLGSFKKVI